MKKRNEVDTLKIGVLQSRSIGWRAFWSVCLFIVIGMSGMMALVGKAQAQVAPTPNPPIVGFIGDSITYGDKTSGYSMPPAPAPTPTASNTSAGNVAGNTLIKLYKERYDATNTTASFVNEGRRLSSTKSWLPNDPLGTGCFAHARAAFVAKQVNVVSFMMGTNDSAQSVTAADYANNLRAIVRGLQAIPSVKLIVLHYPVTPTSAFPYAQQYPSYSHYERILEYQKQLPVVAADPSLAVAGKSIVVGDTTMYRHFEQAANLNQLVDGLHPNDTGAALLGQAWANAIWAYLSPNGTNVTWRLTDISTAPDNSSRLLWTSSDHRLQVWNPNAAGGVAGVGPTLSTPANWIVNAISETPTGESRVLMNYPPDASGNAFAALWAYNVNAQLTAYKVYSGIVSGYTAVDVATDASGNSYILWRGGAKWQIWKAAPNLSATILLPEQTRSDGLLAQSIGIGPDGNLRVLFNNGANKSTFVVLKASDVTAALPQPSVWNIPGWSAIDLAMDSNNHARILWKNADGSKAVLWNMAPNYSYTGTALPGIETYSSSGWNVKRVSVGGDDLFRVLCSNTNSTSTIAFFNSSEAYVRNSPTYSHP